MDKRTRLILVSMVLIALLDSPHSAFAASLDRYSTQQNYSGVNRGYPNSYSSPVDASVYREFREQIQGYDESTKNRMATRYKDKVRSAIRSNDYAAVNHYKRLIQILGY